MIDVVILFIIDKLLDTYLRDINRTYTLYP